MRRRPRSCRDRGADREDRPRPAQRHGALLRHHRPDRSVDRRFRHHRDGARHARRSLHHARRLRDAGALGRTHRQGQPITATAQALPGSKFDGRISGIDNHVDPDDAHACACRPSSTTTSGLLKTGMAIMVELDFDANEELAVPSLAVQWDRRGSFVWKVADGAVRRADVAIVSAAERGRRRQGRCRGRRSASWSRGCCGSARAPRSPRSTRRRTIVDEGAAERRRRLGKARPR